ncbi:unnamed protein product [Schistocephalus solidus]|uniref:Uncharacterized protein n=1 Tax=Schistocephalus solidus TaxID=70667 RepID=A0A3P7CV97_SCHSO|nr:unnamed protein product [Schistocephalus solidus]
MYIFYCRNQQNNNAAVIGSVPTGIVQSVPSRKGSTESPAALVAGVASPLADSIESRKIFVGCLNRQVTNDALRTQFSRFGNVTDAIVIRDWKTGVSMGYGYVTFELPSSADAVLAEPKHQVCGSSVDVRRFQKSKRVDLTQSITVPATRTQQNNNTAVIGSVPTGIVQSLPSRKASTESPAALVDGVASPLADSIESRKIFVGGLNRQVTNDALRTQFSRFGNITDAIVIRTRKTGVSMGYGYVTFELPSSADAVLAEPEHQVCGSSVDVRRFQKSKRVDLTQSITVPASSNPSLPINEDYESLHPIPSNPDSPNTPCKMSAADKQITRIYVGHLKPYVTRTQLSNYFCKFGKIEHVFLAKHRDTQGSLGFGFLQFADSSAVQKILNSGPHNIRDSELVIRPSSRRARTVCALGHAFAGRLREVSSSMSRSASPSCQSVVKVTPSVQKINSRCPNWLACIKGDSCPYGHPRRDCNNKRCNRGPQCCFLHPEDKILLENLRNRINLPAVTARAISNDAHPIGAP